MRIGDLDAIAANTPPDRRDSARPWLLAPIDLQVIKAAGVTFAVSMLERGIEERAHTEIDSRICRANNSIFRTPLFASTTINVRLAHWYVRAVILTSNLVGTPSGAYSMLKSGGTL